MVLHLTETDTVSIIPPPTQISDSETSISSGPELWNDSEDEEDCNMVTVDATFHNIVKVFSIFIILWQSIVRVANVAVSVLLNFLFLFLQHISRLCKNDNMAHFLSIFPNNLKKAKEIANFNHDDFLQYVCCPKCSSIYTMDECFEVVGSVRTAKRCKFALFPRHPWSSRQGSCGAKLFKSVQISQRVTEKTIKLYCYKPIVSSITSILSRPGMLLACEHWRNRKLLPDLYADIYDGKLWKEFEFSGFLSQPNAFGLILNVDWFEPFEHSIYAVGLFLITP